MPTLFTRIIDGEIPGRFVWRDEEVVAFLTIEPMAPGHTLVVPRAEIDHWIDVPDALHDHLWRTAKVIARAIDRAFAPRRVGIIVAGDEVPHVHIHLVGFESVGQLNFASADKNASAASLDAAAAKIRDALRAEGLHPAE